MARKNFDSGTKHLSFLDAAEHVLRRARRPVSGSEITTTALKLGLLNSKGKTPIRTMSAALYMDIARNEKTRFVRLSEKGPMRAVRSSVRWTLKKRTGRKS